MRIAHLSDLHVLVDPTGRGLVRGDAVSRARALVADVAALAPKIDVVAITGDLTDDGEEADYALVRDLLAPLDVPVLAVPGNHDLRVPMRAAFDAAAYEDPFFLHHEAVLGSTRFLALDSLSAGEVGGRLCPARLDWIAGKLSRPFEGDTFLLIHHPPCPTATGVLDDAILIEGNAELRAILAGLERPAHILCGHLHRPIQCLWDRSLVSVATSTAFQFALEIDAERQPPLSDEPFAYRIHIVDGTGTHVIQRRFVSF
ncbi:serine/threonine protein phosphatase [Aquibium carbonis]|uniref:Serine/threonine protein phosphatase n=1 Tax=Aquibium carbonis TaxID=2495581 RepID=A0A3S0A3A4_9HYPH|nr:metallophosphoesterase [Aquibium carbonis]RST83872.1 serine/threonine protein phosphatase [Aquibium carbonis]